METCGTGSQMQLWYLQLQPRFYYHDRCSCRGRCTEQRASHSCWRLTINILLSGPIYVQGHFRSQRCSRTHYVPALMKKSCDWSPPSRCPLVTKLAFSPQSDISQTPVGLVSSDPEMFTYSLVFQWKKRTITLSKIVKMNHTASQHACPSLVPSFQLLLIRPLNVFCRPAGVCLWTHALGPVSSLAAWWMETPVFYMCRRCRRLTPHAGTRQVQQLNSWLVVELIVVSVRYYQSTCFKTHLFLWHAPTW